MKKQLFGGLIAGSLLLFGGQAIAADTDKPKSDSNPQAKADLQVLVGKVQGKLTEGKKGEKDFADELTEFDALLAKYKDQKSDEVAQILLMKAMLFLQVFENSE